MTLLVIPALALAGSWATFIRAGTDMEQLPSPGLVPSSMSGGGELHDSSAAMTSPGSTPVTPMPVGLVENLPQLAVNGGTPSATVPVSSERTRVLGNPLPGGDGPWAQVHHSRDGGRV